MLNVITENHSQKLQQHKRALKNDMDLNQTKKIQDPSYLFSVFIALAFYNL